MPKDERGVVQIIVPLILLAGIAATVFLVTSGPLKLFSRAQSPGQGPAIFDITDIKVPGLGLDGQPLLVVDGDTLIAYGRVWGARSRSNPAFEWEDFVKISIPPDNPATPELDGGREGDVLSFYVSVGGKAWKFQQTAVWNAGTTREMALSRDSIDTSQPGDLANIVLTPGYIVSGEKAGTMPGTIPAGSQGGIGTTQQTTCLKACGWDMTSREIDAEIERIKRLAAVTAFFVGWCDSSSSFDEPAVNVRPAGRIIYEHNSAGDSYCRQTFGDRGPYCICGSFTPTGIGTGTGAGAGAGTQQGTCINACGGQALLGTVRTTAGPQELQRVGCMPTREYSTLTGQVSSPQGVVGSVTYRSAGSPDADKTCRDANAAYPYCMCGTFTVQPGGAGIQQGETTLAPIAPVPAGQVQCSTPTNLVCTHQNPDRLEISWDAVANADRYRTEWSPADNTLGYTYNTGTNTSAIGVTKEIHTASVKAVCGSQQSSPASIQCPATSLIEKGWWNLQNMLKKLSP